MALRGKDGGDESDDPEELQPFAALGPLLQHLGVVRAWYVSLVEVFGPWGMPS